MWYTTRERVPDAGSGHPAGNPAGGRYQRGEVESRNKPIAIAMVLVTVMLLVGACGSEPSNGYTLTALAPEPIDQDQAVKILSALPLD